MLELLSVFVTPLLGGLLGAGLTYVVVKRMSNTDRILEIGDEILSEVTTNTELQKKIYLLGVIVGNGIRQGIGINAKGGGKFKLEDVIGRAIGSLAEGAIDKLFGGKEAGEATATEAVHPFG